MEIWNMGSSNDEQIARYRDAVRPVAEERMKREDAMATARPDERPWTAVPRPTPGEKLAASPGVSDALARFGKTIEDAARDPKFQAMAAGHADRGDRRRVAASVEQFVARPEVIAGLKAAGMSDQAIRAAVESGELERWLRRRGAL